MKSLIHLDKESDTYQTIKHRSESIYKEKGSKFISLAIPVTTESEVKSVLKELKSNYSDAGHHCYGFRLGSNLKTYRFSDDGEPSGTAGKPIFGQIQSFQLTDVLIVVIRYFGGTKLGVGGLIQAYKESAKLAITKNTIIKKHETLDFNILFDYSRMNEIMRIIKKHNLTIIEQNFQEKCTLIFTIRKSKCTPIILELKNLQFHPKRTNTN